MRCPGLYCGLIENATQCGVSVRRRSDHELSNHDPSNHDPFSTGMSSRIPELQLSLLPLLFLSLQFTRESEHLHRMHGSSDLSRLVVLVLHGDPVVADPVVHHRLLDQTKDSDSRCSVDAFEWSCWSDTGSCDTSYFTVRRRIHSDQIVQCGATVRLVHCLLESDSRPQGDSQMLPRSCLSSLLYGIHLLRIGANLPSHHSSTYGAKSQRQECWEDCLLNHVRSSCSLTHPCCPGWDYL